MHLHQGETAAPASVDALRDEFQRVTDWLDARGVTLRQGFTGDAIYHGGTSLELLEDAYAGDEEQA